MAISHPHKRSLMNSEKGVLPMYGDEAIAAKQPEKRGGSRLGPFRIVITRDNVVWMAEFLEDVPGGEEFPGRSHLGNISGKENEPYVVSLVQLADGNLECMCCSAASHVEVAEPCEAQGKHLEKQRKDACRHGFGPASVEPLHVGTAEVVTDDLFSGITLHRHDCSADLAQSDAMSPTGSVKNKTLGNPGCVTFRIDHER